MHTRLYAGSPLKQDSFEPVQVLGLEGNTGGTDGTERAERHAIFTASKTERNGTETERFFDAYCTCMSYRLCITDIVHYKMAYDEGQHGMFSEPTRTGIHTTTQRGTVPSCIDMVHCRKCIRTCMYAWSTCPEEVGGRGLFVKTSRRRMNTHRYTSCSAFFASALMVGQEGVREGESEGEGRRKNGGRWREEGKDGGMEGGWE